MRMQLAKVCMVALSMVSAPAVVSPGPGAGAITGKVTFRGTPARAKPIDMSKEPVCAKMHPKGLLTDNVVTGPGNTLGNVVVYISAGAPDSSAAPATSVSFDQKGCHYTTHVLAFRTRQNVEISNSDPLSHNIHPLAKINREWNRIQPPETPPFSYSYENEEFIPVKCNIHAWMKAYFVVLKASHFGVTGEDGLFRLPDLPPGKYTITAWHETYGTQSQEITIAGDETQTVNFVFPAIP
ncbi:MAG: carboxypeptidase regulatory-like domain-containing protein [Acidobacteriia bacterium]|nr:carboxypeptidase regulatory-like domain-containing protein [Terriglobia bacterium]